MATSARSDGELKDAMWSSQSDEPSKHLEDKEDDHPSKPDIFEQGTNDEVSLSKERDSGSWSGDQAVKTARYNHVAEKSLSLAEAKLFYQRHKLETSHQNGETVTPLTRWGTSFAEELGGLSRTDSIASRESGYGGRRGESNSLSVLPVTSVGLDESIIGQSTLSSEPGKNDTCVSSSNQALQQDGSSLLEKSEKIPPFGTEDETQHPVIDGSHINQEMRTICTLIKNVLDIRHRYIELSLQRPHDNPKDKEDWIIYPPPPQPVWDDVNNRPHGLSSGPNSLKNSKVLSPDDNPADAGSLGGSPVQQLHNSSAKKPRKPGQHVGEDFDLSDCLPLPEEGDFIYKLDNNSVYQVYENSNLLHSNMPMAKVPTLGEFYMDLEYVKDVSSDGPSKSFAYRELDILEGEYNLYYLVHEYEETASCKKVPHRDFYNVRKVDTHVHHSSCMNQKHLLRFIKSKMKKSPDEVVLFRDGKRLTLKEVFESINLTAYDLSIDTLDMHVCIGFLDTSSTIFSY